MEAARRVEQADVFYVHYSQHMATAWQQHNYLTDVTCDNHDTHVPTNTANVTLTLYVHVKIHLLNISATLRVCVKCMCIPPAFLTLCSTLNLPPNKLILSFKTKCTARTRVTQMICQKPNTSCAIYRYKTAQTQALCST